MKLLFLDFETQSDDPQTTNPTEVGALLVERRVRQGEPDEFVITRELSQLIYDPSYPSQTAEIVELTGITDEMLNNGGLPPAAVFAWIHAMVEEADYVLAHNAAFDRGVYEATARRVRMDIAKPKKGWLCTIQDIPWAKKYKCKKLAHLAYDHGYMVDPSTLHRALDDVKLLSELVLRRSHMSLDQIIAYKETPWAYLRAVVPAPWEDGGVGTGQAKKLGYGWEKIFGTDLVFPKKWVKRVKETEIEAEKARCPFKLMRLTPETAPAPVC